MYFPFEDCVYASELVGLKDLAETETVLVVDRRVRAS